MNFILLPLFWVPVGNRSAHDNNVHMRALLDQKRISVDVPKPLL